MFNVSSTKSGSFLVIVFSILLCAFLFVPVTVSEAIDPCGAAGDTYQTGPTFTVTRTDDTDNLSCCAGTGGAPLGCSLREAINAANSYVGTATINATELEATINLNSTLPTITNSITLNGVGQTIDASTIPGGGRILHINASGQTVAINGLELTGGNFGIGAAILVANGTVNLSQCVIHDNSGDEGVGIAIDAAAPVNTVTISETSFANNTSGVVDPTSASVIRNRGATTISKSTISGNSGGVPILNFDTAGSSLTLTNSTISGNVAPITSVIDNEGGSITISYSTIADNLTLDEFSNGALYANGGGTITIAKSIIANNNNDFSGAPDSSCVSAGGGSFVDSGYNIEAGNTCGFAGTSMADTDPILAGLGGNGGLTETMALLDGSPALDVISAPCGVATDQRGASRPYNVKCDIGAYESTLSYTINATSDAGGTISPAGVVTLLRGSSQAFIITPDSTHDINSIYVNGQLVAKPYVLTGGIYTYTFSNITASQTIHVAYLPKFQTITIAKAGGGTVTPLGSVSVARAGSLSVSFSGGSTHDVSAVYVNGQNLGVIPSPYVFNNVTADQTMHIAFIPKTYIIASSTHSRHVGYPSGGSISPVGAVSVARGGDKTFTVTPNPGYHTTTIVVDGVNTIPNNPTGNSTYTINNVREPHSIFAEFATYMTSSFNTGGTVTPASGTYRVYNGDIVAWTITPDAQHDISAVYVNGTLIPGPYTLNAQGKFIQWVNGVVAPPTIAVTFVSTNYTITATSGSGGSIAPAGAVSVARGGSQAFTVTPLATHNIQAIYVNGQLVAGPYTLDGFGNYTYTFSNVQTNQTINASFIPKQYPVNITYSANGTIVNRSTGLVVPSGTAVMVNRGAASPIFDFVPNGGYAINSVYVNFVNIGTPVSYQFPVVNSAQYLFVQFR